ncbi:hypothetical protein PAMP_004201 [Pampus punctatissimus]
MEEEEEEEEERSFSERTAVVLETQTGKDLQLCKTDGIHPPQLVSGRYLELEQRQERKMRQQKGGDGRSRDTQQDSQQPRHTEQDTSPEWRKPGYLQSLWTNRSPAVGPLIKADCGLGTVSPSVQQPHFVWDYHTCGSGINPSRDMGTRDKMAPV